VLLPDARINLFGCVLFLGVSKQSYLVYLSWTGAKRAATVAFNTFFFIDLRILEDPIRRECIEMAQGL
jgi:hypothetical protein